MKHETICLVVQTMSGAINTDVCICDLIREDRATERKQAAKRIRDAVMTLYPVDDWDVKSKYDCCGCSTYSQIAEDAITAALGGEQE